MTFSDRALDEWLTFAVELADTAHARLAPAGRVRPDAIVKPDRSFVTAVDAEIELRGCGGATQGLLGALAGAGHCRCELDATITHDRYALLFANDPVAPVASYRFGVRQWTVQLPAFAQRRAVPM